MPRLGVAGFLCLYTYGSTVIYFQKAELAHDLFADRAVRTAFYARVDLAVNTLAALGQALLVGRLLPRADGCLG